MSKFHNHWMKPMFSFSHGHLLNVTSSSLW